MENYNLHYCTNEKSETSYFVAKVGVLMSDLGYATQKCH